MTDNVKHSTSYYHEAIAYAFEMFKNGYEPVMETPFQPRRLGSAFVTEYKPVRESLDLTEIENANEILDKPPKPNERLRKLIEESKDGFKDIAADENCNLVDNSKKLIIQEKWQVDDLFTEIQKMQKYKSNNPGKPFSGVVEIEDKEGNLVRAPGIVGYKRFGGDLSQIDNEVDKEQIKVYSKEELEGLEWSEFKKLIDAADIRGRRRQNLTRDYLIYQEENLK